MIKQSSLQKFQEEMETVMKDPYKVVMKQRKLPMSLFYDRIKPHVSAAVVFILNGQFLCTQPFIFCTPSFSYYQVSFLVSELLFWALASYFFMWKLSRFMS